MDDTTNLNCINCNVKLENKTDLLAHLNDEVHKMNKNKLQACGVESVAEPSEIYTPPPIPVNTNLICTLCNIIVSNPESMVEHKNGKKHSKRLALEAKKPVEQKCSVNNGFPCPPTPELAAGPSVLKTPPHIPVDTKLICKLCNMAIPNPASMLAHQNGIKHAKKLAYIEANGRGNGKCGVFIKGFPLPTNKPWLYEYFSKYGEIVWFHFGNSYMIVDYADNESVETLMNEDRFISGRRLFIRHRYPDDNPKKPKVEELVDLVLKLKTVEKLGDQLRILSRTLQPHLANITSKYETIVSDLFMCLQKSFSIDYIHPFGSAVTGLGFYNSDLDLYIEGVSRSNDDETASLYKTKGLMLKSKKFDNIVVIARAKTPILKCLHLSTNLYCDINFRSMLGVCNSKLISNFLSVNGKLKMLAIFLKYWAKVHELTEINRFTNYSLCIMIVFFLQQKPFAFPSVAVLQEDTSCMNLQIGWNGGFQPIKEDLDNCVHNKSFVELLKLFFDYYSKVDYKVKVISPYTGDFLTKNNFTDTKTLPSCFSVYKQRVVSKDSSSLKTDCPICVQDPFEHTRNITGNVSSFELQKFVSLCQIGREFCDEGEDYILYKLLSIVPTIRTPTSTALVPPSNVNNVLYTSVSALFFITMDKNLPYLADVVGEEAKKDAWFSILVKFVIFIFEKLFRFEVTELSLPSSKCKSKRVEGQTDVYKTCRNEVVLRCEANLNLWDGREIVESLTKKSLIEQEIELTESLCNHYKNFSKENIMNFKITFVQMDEPSRVVLKLLKNVAYKKCFKTFAQFFIAKLPVWFDVHQRELTKASTK